MSQTENELETQKVVEAAIASVISYNQDQEYYSDDRTYAEHFIKDKANILKTAGVKEVDDYEIDRALAIQEIKDTIKESKPDLQRLIDKGVAYVSDENEYPAVHISHPDIEHSLIFSWEPEKNATDGLVGEGAIIYSWGDDEGIRYNSLNRGLDSTESSTISKLYSIAEAKECKGELEENEAYKDHIKNGDLTVKSVKITAAEFSKFPGGLDEENHVSGVIQYQIEGRDFESKFKQKISGGDYFKETVYDNVQMLDIGKLEGKTIFLDIETGYKDDNQQVHLSGKNRQELSSSINNMLKKAEPVLTANYNKPNPKLLNEVDKKDGKHYSFKPETLEALVKFGEALEKVENKKRNKPKV